MFETSLLPLEALADELGSVAARIEREVRLQVDVILLGARAELEASARRLVERELALERAERERETHYAARLAEVHDGQPGEPGEPGSDGKDGAPGKDGESIVGPPGRDGKDGAPGKDGESITGPPGRDGKDGESIVGEPGRDGIDGAPGKDGESITGPPGEPGRDGKDGAPGKDGESITGPRGEPGPPGRLTEAVEWTDRVFYEGEVAIRDGASYQAVRDTGRAPPSEDWRCIAAAGRDGAPGRSLIPRGTWDPLGSYRALDMVMTSGSSFVALRDDPGICPGAGWQLIASRGRAGPAGDKGQPGERGYPGPPGASVSTFGVDDDGVLTLRLSDGATLTADLYPLLVRVSRA